MTNTRRAPDLTPSDRQLIAQFLMANSKDGIVHRGKVKEVASSFGVSRRTIQYTWAAAKKQMLDGSPCVFSSKKIGTSKRVQVELNADLMKSIPFEKRTTIRRLSRELNVSKSKVGRWIKKGIIKPHTNVIKPELTEANKLLRLRYSLSSLKVDWQGENIKFQTMHNVIHIDEKWFFMTRTSERYYIIPGEDEPHRSCKSKRYIPKVMFMCAVSRPQYSSDGVLIFDGKICIFPFTERLPAKRNSKNRPKGTMVTTPIESITKDVTRDCLVHQIIPAIKAKWPQGASKDIIIQQDNAKPHISNDDPEFRAAASSDGFNIQLICQPANSPDTNVNDLGWFRAIQSLQVDTASYNVDELIKNVLLSFEKLEHVTLNNIFLSLQNCMVEIMKVKGGINYKVPHMGKAALMRQGILPSTLEVDEFLVREGIEHLIEHNQTQGASYDIGQLMSDLGYQ